MDTESIRAAQISGVSGWTASARRAGARLAACGLAACALALIGAGPAHAADYFVDSTADGPDLNPGNGLCATAIGECTLRAAMQETQAQAGADTINLLGLSDPSTIDLGSALPTISGQTLTITGAGQDALTVRRNSGGDYSIFTIVPTDIASNVSIAGMTITNGRAVGSPSGFPAGGGIYSFAGSLELDDVAVVGNAVVASGGANGLAEGGGVYKEQGTLTIRNSTISQNTVEITGGSGAGFGGGIAQSNGGDLQVVNSTISQNSVTVTGPGGVEAKGGGIAVFANTIEIVDSTVSENTAAASDASGAFVSGGGIEAFGSSLTLLTSTVDHNAATAANVASGPLVVGGGISVTGTLTVGVTSSTISANSVAATPAEDEDVVAGGGMNILAGALTISGSTLAFNVAPLGANLEEASSATKLRNTILSNPLGGGANCDDFDPPTLVSDGYNLASDASCNLIGTGDQPSTDPTLEALADNGGPTWTHALPLGSPAVDRGNAAAFDVHPALTTDQRGEPRPFDQPAVPDAADGSDVGAFELQFVANVAPVAVDDAYAVIGGGVLTVPVLGVLGNDTDLDGDPLTAQLVAGPSSGVLVLDPDGSFSFTPGEDTVGPVSFTYQASDGTALSNVVTVTITVRAGCDGVPATIVGTAGNNTINGTGGNDVIVGLGGNDEIRSGSGNDRVCGGSGRDEIASGSGNDRVFGGTGNDSVEAGSGDDSVFGGDGNDLLDGGGDRDRLFGEAGIDQLFGGGDPDVLDGGADSPDRCDGEGGSDTTTGGCEQTTSIP